MDGTISEALVVLLVGMLTVFVILSLVVLSGRLLLIILNRTNFILNKKEVVAAESRAPTDPTKLKLIKLAVQQWSKGEAQVINVDSD